MLGLCENATQEGDVVVLLKGCQTPVVLREVDVQKEGLQVSDTAGKGGYSKFVGGVLCLRGK